jgi:hypothetical protein
MLRRFLLAASFFALFIPRPACAQQTGATPAPRPAAGVPEGQRRQSVVGEAAGSADGLIKGRVLDESGQPLAGALVLARPAGRSGPFAMAGTDGDGNFQVPHLAHTSYQLTAIVAGYVAAQPSQRGRRRADYYQVGETLMIQMAKGGVITGKVTGQGGEPAIATHVRAVRVRDGAGNKVTPTPSQRRWLTDDRGVYRIYGLEPGSYLVAAAGGDSIQSPPGASNDSAFTYYPSATHDGAAEVSVGGGQETGGIDVRLVNARGYAVSGFVSGDITAVAPPGGLALSLTHLSNGVPESSTSIYGDEGNRSFSFYGVPDGEYELTARGGLGSELALASNPRRVTVKGASVTGVELKVVRLGSIAGRVVVEPARQINGTASCQDAPHAAVAGMILTARPDVAGTRGIEKRPPADELSESAADGNGDFVLRDLAAGRYRVEARLPTDDWYVRAVTLNVAGREAQTNVSGDGFMLRAGERVESLTVKLADGAAGIRGRIVTAGGVTLRYDRLRVYLVPSARADADDAAYFAESAVQENGTFSFGNVAPGRYWVLVRPGGDESAKAPARPASWDAEWRAQLRREAGRVGSAVELQPCRRVGDFSLNYVPDK